MKDVLSMKLLSRKERRAHLDLKENCLERGGNSSIHQGVLAQYLNTNIPEKIKGIMCLCHACHNAKCSNPKHLYWGTYSDNMIDAQENGRPSFHELTKRVRGDDVYSIINKTRKR